MARWEFKLPDIGEGVTEGEIVTWLIKPGDLVKEDQPMIEVMTDKATVTITSPRAGRVVETRGAPGSVVAVHGVLVVFELDGGSAEAEKPEAHKTANGNGHHANGGAKSEPAATAVGDIKEHLPGMGGGSPAPRTASVSSGGGGGGAATQTYFNEKPLATPATRKLARDMNVDLRNVPPTGPQGRVTKVDVEAFLKAPQATTAAPAPTAAPAATTTTREAVKIAPGGLEERVPFAGLRRKIAAKMAQSVHTAAHFTFVEECDVTALKALRARLKPQAEKQSVKLSFLPFIVKAVVASLKKHPILNSALDESTNELVYRKYYNIGIAASTDAGLIVPVVKDADRRSLLDIAREIDRIATDAKNGKSKMEDLSGSTFTITSLGSDGGLFATPILNFPEVGILGVHQMKQKPVVKDGQIVIGDVMLLSLSFDHRIVDGHVGAAFAYDVIRFLEDPDRLFLEMA
ncbi:MAG: 2-oxo acid dehydrogenase subunit E2 [Deltaproteobacteria bacterium]|nr:2-oxo acid dehydrogenase subunit E2 [Deltaproteobacteria bacterium]